MDSGYLDRLYSLADPAHLFGRKGAWTTLWLGFVVGIAVAGVLGTKTTVPAGWLLAVIAGIIVVALTVRFVAKEWYYRTGPQPRLGIVYDPLRVNVEEYSKVKSTLSAMLDAGTREDIVTLKVVPVSVAEVPAAAERFRRRYSLEILYRIQQSPTVGGDGSTLGDAAQIATTLTAQFGPIRMTENLLQNTIVPAGLALATRLGRKKSVAKVIEANVQGLHDAILLIVVGVSLARKRYGYCAALLSYLETRLNTELPAAHPLLKHVRRLDCISRLEETYFRMAKLPDPLELDRIRRFSESAMRHLEEWPSSFFVLARLQFLMGDVEAAFQLNERILSQKTLNPAERATGLLNRGFLCCDRTEWDNSAAAYREMVDIPDHNKLSWDEIIEFADYAADQGFQAGLYAQALYRHVIGRQPLSSAERKPLDTWLNADPSRDALNQLLRKLPRQMQVKSPPKSRRGKSKAKRRRKKRNSGR